MHQTGLLVYILILDVDIGYLQYLKLKTYIPFKRNSTYLKILKSYNKTTYYFFKSNKFKYLN